MKPITYKPNPDCEGGMEVHRYGKYVSEAEYNELKAEVARLKAEVERLTNTSTNADRFLISGLEQDVAILKAEVKRLTKAEDKMIEVTYIKGVAGVDRMGGKK